MTACEVRGETAVPYVPVVLVFECCLKVVEDGDVRSH